MKRLHVIFLGLCLCLLAACTPGKRHSLRVMSYNIHVGVGLDKVYDLKRTADVILSLRPDFVGMQEVDSVTGRTEWVDQAVELGRLTGMYPVFAPAIEFSQGLYGIAALVREVPLAVRRIPLPGEEERRTFLLLEYQDYLLCNTHLSLTDSSRTEAIRLIRNTLEQYDKPALITGDFNMQPSSAECRLMGETWMLLSDSTQFTFPADTPRVTIDYVWGRKEYEYQVSHAEVVEEPVVSDHRPVYVDITF